MSDTQEPRGSTPYKAVFPTVARAKEFGTRVQEPGWCTANVVQKGRTVTWDVPHAAATTRSYFADMLDTVGYYGSDDSRKATLNGVPAPRAW